MPQIDEKLVRFTYRTPFGQVTLQSDGESIIRLALGRQELEGIERACEVTNDAATQVNEYLAGKRTTFEVPLTIAGSAFQKAVWEAACDIPYGQTRTPSEIAALIGSPDAARSIGRAVRENPIAILIPAHRIAPSNGRVDPQDPGAMLRKRFRELEARFA